MKTIFSTLAILSLIVFGGCESYVQNIDPQINSFDDALLNNESETDFIITGVKGKFADAYGQLSVMSGGLSDELVFDFNVPNATYPQYNDIDIGIITLNNNSIIDGETSLGELRFFADTLVGRTFVITYTDSTNMFKGRYNGYLYGGIARYFYASYFGLDKENGGGCINLGPFIPSIDMYALALEKFDNALEYAQSPYEARIVHSLKARINLILGKNAEAATEAAMGMINGDDPLTALFNSEAPNFWWFDAGNSRTQWVVDGRYNAYIVADSNEVSRIQITEIMGNDGATIYHYQVKYPEDKSPIPFITWQENELVQAEVLVRNSQNAEALIHINNVRASHGLSDRTETAIDSIYIERDKELFCTGNRLIDQRRFDKWHLAAGTWKFLPITQRERNANPNLQ